ncbi:MAG TPA: hypothetical protein VF218_07160 [Acidothermaceae bacterium]
MPYACVHDVPSSWTEYERAAESLVDPLPRGLLAHLAGPTDEGVRIIEIWDDEASAASFRDERLSPMIALLTDAPSHRSAVRDLHAVHLVIADVTGAAATHREGSTR